MRPQILLTAAIFLIQHCRADATTAPCPILGPPFPKPRHLRKSDVLQNSLRAFNEALDQGLKNGSTKKFGSYPFKDMTFSIGMFGIYDDNLLYEYHHTAPDVVNSSEGVHKANADSIYRIGSISKLLTVYIFLVQEGFSRWEDLVAKYVPELAEAPENMTSANGVLGDWNEVTIGDIAGQLSGVARDLSLNDLGALPGAPELTPDQISECDRFDPITGAYKECNEQQYLSGLSKVPAIWQTGHTPTYSNAGYALLGLILERITKKSYTSLFYETLVQPLNLTSTTIFVPKTTGKNAIIPTGNDTSSLFSTDLGFLNPSGSIYSSTSDLSKIGRAILNSTLLSRAVTNRWLKPRTFTTDFRSQGGFVGVGEPWEIYIASNTSSGLVVELYTKRGGWGAYFTYIMLIPAYGVGFTFMTASTIQRSNLVLKGLVSLAIDIVLPGLFEAAREEAEKKFTGTFGGINETSVKISTDQYPGLRVKEFLANGVDQLTTPFGVVAGSGKYVDMRLFPNELYSKESGKVGFTGVWDVLPREENDVLTPCSSWNLVDAPTWGSVGLADYVFEVDDTGKAMKVSPKAYRMTLEKVHEQRQH